MKISVQTGWQSTMYITQCKMTTVLNMYQHGIAPLSYQQIMNILTTFYQKGSITHF